MGLHINLENGRNRDEKAERSEKLQFIIKLPLSDKSSALVFHQVCELPRSCRHPQNSNRYPAQRVCLSEQNILRNKRALKEKQDNKTLRVAFVLAGFWAELNKQSERGLEMTLEQKREGRDPVSQ